jgi:hypothetical protein
LEEITDFIEELFDEKTRGQNSQETSYDNFQKKRMKSGTSKILDDIPLVF